MPDEQTNQTPPGGGTGDQTPQSGTDGQTATGSTSSTPPVDYEQKFKASQAEAMRLYQENQRMQAIMAHTAQQARQAPAPPEPVQSKPREQLTDAVLDRDLVKLEAYEDYVIGRAEQRIMSRQQQDQVRQSRIAASMGEISNVLKDPNSPLAHAALQRYQTIQFNPNYQIFTDDSVDVGNVKVNPHILRIAVLEARAEMASKGGAMVDSANAQSSFIEPVGGAPRAAQESGKFNPDKHLSERERDACTKQGWSFDTYWGHMNPKLKEARLKAGKPLSSKDAGV